MTQQVCRHRWVLTLALAVAAGFAAPAAQTPVAAVRLTVTDASGGVRVDNLQPGVGVISYSRLNGALNPIAATDCDDPVTCVGAGGFIDGGFTSFDDPTLAYGTIPDHRRHRLTLSAVWAPGDYRGSSSTLKALLSSWTVSVMSQTFSRPPLNTLLTGLDLDGDGLSADDLRHLVEQYNSGVAAATRTVARADGGVDIIRPRTPFNPVINPIMLPEQFAAGDLFNTQDLRLTRQIGLAGSTRLLLTAEVFNVFNISNLTGYSGVLNQPGYGQPSARVGQVFGTGGPRAFQFAARVQF